MAQKKMTLTLYEQNFVRKDWAVDLKSSRFELFFIELADDLARFGIELERGENDGVTIDVNSYADVLNAVRSSVVSVPCSVVTTRGWCSGKSIERARIAAVACGTA